MVGPRQKALGALLVIGLGCASVGHQPSTTAVPDVRLLDGSVVSWSSLLVTQGDTVVVFATPWCEICRRERPEVEAWAKAHPDPKRTVYVFSGGELPGVAEQIRALHMDDTGLTIVLDPDGKLADHYAVQSTPTVFVLGPEGHVLSTQHRFKAIKLD